MSEEKFTQSEWNKRGCTVYCEGIPIARTENPKANSLLSYVYDDKTILECEIGQEQAESNSDLIAAAPDMYRALCEVVDDAQSYCNRTGRNITWLSEAFAALAKARGEL